MHMHRYHSGIDKQKVYLGKMTKRRNLREIVGLPVTVHVRKLCSIGMCIKLRKQEPDINYNDDSNH